MAPGHQQSTRMNTPFPEGVCTGESSDRGRPRVGLVVESTLWDNRPVHAFYEHQSALKRGAPLAQGLGMLGRRVPSAYVRHGRQWMRPMLPIPGRRILIQECDLREDECRHGPFPRGPTDKRADARWVRHSFPP